MLHTTYFQQFWDVRGAIDPQQGDIPKLREWAKNLGENVAKGRGGDLTFLLIRGGLILRYPNALIYAHKKGSDLTADHLYPSLRISIISGVVLLGFNLTKVEDWRFFVEEHFTEPYFGPKMNSQIHNNTYVSYLQLQEEGTPLAEDSATVAQEILHARYYRELKVTM